MLRFCGVSRKGVVGDRQGNRVNGCYSDELTQNCQPVCEGLREAAGGMQRGFGYLGSQTSLDAR